jgi:hypothetical protein
MVGHQQQPCFIIIVSEVGPSSALVRVRDHVQVIELCVDRELLILLFWREY